MAWNNDYFYGTLGEPNQQPVSTPVAKPLSA